MTRRAFLLPGRHVNRDTWCALVDLLAFVAINADTLDALCPFSDLSPLIASGISVGIALPTGYQLRSNQWS